MTSDVRRAQLAQEVIDNPVYAEAWAVIESEIIATWRAARSPDDREQLHRLLLAHGQAKTALEAVMRSGEIAQAELTRQQTRAEQMQAIVARRAA